LELVDVLLDVMSSYVVDVLADVLADVLLDASPSRDLHHVAGWTLEQTRVGPLLILDSYSP
jgi:hypothetical protein